MTWARSLGATLVSPVGARLRPGAKRQKKADAEAAARTGRPSRFVARVGSHSGRVVLAVKTEEQRSVEKESLSQEKTHMT